MKQLRRFAALTLLAAVLLSGCQASQPDAGSAADSEPVGAVGYAVIPGREDVRPEKPEPETPSESGPPSENSAPPEGKTETEEIVMETDPAEDAVRRMLAEMTLEERVAQMFFAESVDACSAVPGETTPGGCILFSSDLSGLTSEEVRQKLAELQRNAKIPLLIGTDEEGGTVARVSANADLRSERFSSPRRLYESGGMERVLEEEREKAELLLSLGINVNLAPVCDVTGNPASFMYARSISGDSSAAAEFAARVTAQMSEQGLGWVMRHFPGYGECGDTHQEVIRDPADASLFETAYLEPFRAGAGSGIGGVMVCHNIVEAWDDALPASLSPAVHRRLRKELGEEIVVLTDDLDMRGITGYTDGNEAAILAILAGNDMLLTWNPAKNIDTVTDAVRIGTIPETMIDESVSRILRWKLALGLIDPEPASVGTEE